MSQNHVKPDRESTTAIPPKTPRWVKVFGIIAIALILLAMIIMIVGGGSHGPGRHIPTPTLIVEMQQP